MGLVQTTVNNMEHFEKFLVSEKRDKGAGKTFRVSQSSVLDRAKNFMPLLAEANQDLVTKITAGKASQIDIENTEDCHSSIIEMNLALFEAEDSSSEDDSDYEVLDCSCDEIDCSCTTPPKCGPINTLKLPSNGSIPKGTKPVIEVISSGQIVDQAESQMNCKTNGLKTNQMESKIESNSNKDNSVDKDKVISNK